MHETLRVRDLPGTYKALPHLSGEFIIISSPRCKESISSLRNITSCTTSYLQPHSLDGIKMSKDKKKHNSQEMDGNQKLESGDNVNKMHGKEQHKCVSRTRRRSGEILRVASPITSYTQVIMISREKLKRTRQVSSLRNHIYFSFAEGGAEEETEWHPVESTAEDAE